MHKNGWWHNSLETHNITLDCRIVDLGVGKLKSEDDRFGDKRCAENSFKDLTQILGFENELDKFLIKQFEESYDSVFLATP